MSGYYIFCDESLKRGRYYSNFYGGLMIGKKDFEKVNNALRSLVQDLGIEGGELKWSYVNPFRLEQYKAVMDATFQFIRNDVFRIRIMFTDNRFIPANLSKEHRDNQYHILYYHFLKHAFGLRHLRSTTNLDLEIFFDKMPDTDARNENFKKFIYGLQFLPDFADSSIQVGEDSVSEVDSEKYILLQCLDIILGSIAFRLNDMHKKKNPVTNKKGRRTIAKELLFKHINMKIREIRPGFNISISTGIDGDERNTLFHPYRHWLCIPKNTSFEPDRV